MKSQHRIILGILSVIACSMAAISLYVAGGAYAAWSQRPLGPLLQSPTFAPLQLPATWTVTPFTTVTLAATQSFPTGTPVPSGILPCYGLPSMTILAIGTDARSDEYKYGRADVIRVVRVDYIAQRVSVLEFPRDLWVKIPEISDNIKQDHDKLNTAYFFGNPGLHFWDDPSAGPGLLARTLALNFGVKVDHYIAVNMNIFVDLVDALGGIDITLPQEVDGRTGSDRSARLYFPTGAQHLNGEQALTLGRIRNVSVFSRAKHENLLMCAVRKKVESPLVLAEMPQIISAFSDRIQTDLTPVQISQLACLGTSPSAHIQFASFPRELFVPSEIYDASLKQKVFIWDANFATLSSYVEQFNAGTWPAQSLSSEPSPEMSSCE